jgi:hypothetical protein
VGLSTSVCVFESRSGLYQISREVELSALNDPVDLRTVSKQFENSLRYAGYKYIHQGMYIIEIKGMTRKKLGTNILVTLLDKGWDTINKASLGFLEGDMNENSLITYIAPDLIMSVQELYIYIQTHTRPYKCYSSPERANPLPNRASVAHRPHALPA